MTTATPASPEEIERLIEAGELFPRLAAARYCGLSRTTFDNRRRVGLLHDEREKFGADRPLFTKAQLDAFLKAEKEKTQSEAEEQQAPDTEAEPGKATPGEGASEDPDALEEKLIEGLRNVFPSGEIHVRKMRIQATKAEAGREEVASPYSEEPGIYASLGTHLMTVALPGGKIVEQQELPPIRRWHSHLQDQHGEIHCFSTTFDGEKFQTRRS